MCLLLSNSLSSVSPAFSPVPFGRKLAFDSCCQADLSEYSAVSTAVANTVRSRPERVGNAVFDEEEGVVDELDWACVGVCCCWLASP